MNCFDQCKISLKEVNLPREWVENVVKEVVDAFWRSFEERKRATINLNQVGAVQIQGEVVRGTFLGCLDLHYVEWMLCLHLCRISSYD